MKIRSIALLILLIFSFLLLTFKLSDWPTIWYDEGRGLQASRNLAATGQYGMNSSEGFRYFDPLISKGPTLIFPIAWIFKFIEVDLFWARMLIVFYSLLAILAFFSVGENVFDQSTAFVGSLLLITLTASLEDISGSFLGLSRMVLGEVPALFFLLAGTFLWFRSIDRGGKVTQIVAGVCFGLAILTKTQFLLLVGGFVIIYAVDKAWYRQLRVSQIAIPLIVSIMVVTVWYAYQMYQTGSVSGSQSSVLDRIGTQIPVLSLQLILRSVRVLLESQILIWGMPGLLLGIYLSREKSILGLKRGFLLVLCLLWLLWFVVGTIGWIRYAFPGIAIMTLFTAKLLVDLSDNLLFFKELKRSGLKGSFRNLDYFRSFTVIVAIALMIIIPLEVGLKNITTADGKAPFRITEYLDNHMPMNVIIETAEPEIAFLSDRNFHQISIDEERVAIQHAQLGVPYPQDFYPINDVNPDYLLVGPFARNTELYSGWRQERELNEVITIGGYSLYKLERAKNP